MLDKIGVKKLDDLYSDVPAEFLHKGAYALAGLRGAGKRFPQHPDGEGYSFALTIR